jgi:Domain of unknown function (DUF3883)
MAQLEDLTQDVIVKGIYPNQNVTVIDARSKGRIEGSETVTVTRNEILYALNKPNNFVLALVSSSIGNHKRSLKNKD